MNSPAPESPIPQLCEITATEAQITLMAAGVGCGPELAKLGVVEILIAHLFNNERWYPTLTNKLEKEVKTFEPLMVGEAPRTAKRKMYFTHIELAYIGATIGCCITQQIARAMEPRKAIIFLMAYKNLDDAGQKDLANQFIAYLNDAGMKMDDES